MEKRELSVTEYVVDRSWSILAEKGSEETKYHLLNKVAGTSKTIGTAPTDENVDTFIEQMLPKLNSYKEDIVFDTRFVPKHFVDRAAEMYKDCKWESDFVGNMTYMVLGILVKAYNEIIETNAFPLEDGDPSIAIMTGVKKVGNTLLSVEHRGGMANVVASDKIETLN